MDEERNLNPTDAQEQFALADAYYYGRSLAQGFTKALYEKNTQNMLAYGYNMRVPTLLTKLGLSQRMRTELTRGEAQAEELLTVGITPFNDSYKWGDHYVRITENMIRAEHGLGKRMA